MVVDSEKSEVSKFRTYLPQILASTAKNLLILDIGLAASFPTIVIPALRGNLERADPNEILHFTDVQASWFGSIAFICTPIGSILSGWVTEPIGRKNAMIICNLPHIIAWLMLHYASSLTELYIAVILLGLGVGFMEAPVVTYVGEICQPRIRGILTSCAGVAATLGFFLGYLLGSVVTWRNAALICLSIPVFTAVAICFVPETPFWLLSKGREEKALKSLQWLRGWVSPKVVEKEFEEMQRYNKTSTRCTPCQKSDTVDCDHPPPTIKAKLAEFRRKRTLKPMIIVTMFFLFTQFTGLSGMRPYLVQIFQAFGAPIDPSWATVIVGFLKFLANIACMVAVRFTGKRKISLISIAGTTMCCIAIGIYSYVYLPANYSSFDNHAHEDVPGDGIFPMIMFFSLAFITSAGMIPIPWMLLSEVFPFKCRATAAGIVAALCYIMIFISTKTYLNLERGLGLTGVLFFYSAVGICGYLFFYFFLPETENRSLEDIEIHFSTQKMTNIKIKKSVYESKSVENGVESNKNKEATLENGCDNKGYVEHEK